MVLMGLVRACMHENLLNLRKKWIGSKACWLKALCTRKPTNYADSNFYYATISAFRTMISTSSIAGATTIQKQQQQENDQILPTIQ